MADTKITNLATATAATGQEIPVNTAGTDNKITVGAILNLLQGVYTGTVGTSAAPITGLYLSGVTGLGGVFKGNAQVGLLKSVTTVTATGQTYDPGDHVNFIIVEIVGGGGSGANMAAGTSANGAGGGGAGGYARRLITTATLGTGAVTITLGTGGAAGATAAGGNAGTSTLFGAFCTACGGQGGTTGAGASGAAGGAATSGDINITGQAGGPTLLVGATAAALARRLGGRGGSSVKYGLGGSEQSGITGAIVSGNNAVGFGGGGGGGVSVPAAASGSAAGGTGAGGICIIWEYV